MRDGACAGFKYFSFEGLKSISIVVRGDAEGKMEVYTRDNDVLIASVKIHNSENFVKYDAEVCKKIDGKEALYFTYKGKGSIDFKEFELI